MGFVVHGLLIGADYARLTSLFRAHDDMMAHFWALALANFIWAAGFTRIYRPAPRA